MLKLTIEDGVFKDSSSREVVLRGINFAADAKLPVNPYRPSHAPDDDGFFDGDNVSFVGSPFPLSEFDVHLARLRAWGFNTLRYIFTWEALEHKGPGIYDDEFVQFTIEALRKISNHGFYIIMDPHQDCWARFSGGCGAPLWTLYAAGLNPRTFGPTHAAMLESHFVGRENEKPNMLWATNYARLAAATMYTLFFAGRTYAPKCIINGVNIQNYLESHFINAVRYLAVKVCEAIDHDANLGNSILGWESINEPGHGYIGTEDLTEIPKGQQVRLYTTPTGAQAMALGSGIPQDVLVCVFLSTGVKVLDNKFRVDPQGASVWLSQQDRDKLDEHYGWTRGAKWEGGKCIWQLHGVWKPNAGGQFVILRPDYFAYDIHGTRVTDRRFVEGMFVDHWLAYAKALREVIPSDAFLFCQPPVMQRPPALKSRGLVDPYMVYTPHYYDGLTLMLKRWNPKFNVDALGVLRGRYGNPPVKAVRLGETNIRKCFGEQLRMIKQEGIEQFGEGVPCLMSEIGIPYDMEGGLAYRTGDYSAQARAMDANNYALEFAKLSHTLWCYAGRNTNEHGDGWNGEDLSIWSTDPVVVSSSAAAAAAGIPNNRALSKQASSSSLRSQASSLRGSHFNRKSRQPLSSKLSQSMFSLDRRSAAGDDSDDTAGAHASSAPLSRSSTASTTASRASFTSGHHHDPREHLRGARAPEAFIRPFPLNVAGSIVSYKFDMMKCYFRLRIRGGGFGSSSVGVNGDAYNDNDNDDDDDEDDTTSGESLHAARLLRPQFKASCPDSLPTVVFMPTFHFSPETTHAWTSSGACYIDRENQLLYWYHDPGSQELKLYGQLKTVQDKETGMPTVKKESCVIA